MNRLLLARGDLSGFWALLADNLANLVLIAGVCLGVFGMPERIVFGRILPGAGLALLVGYLVYYVLALRLGRAEGRYDVTALPYGISTPVLFVYLFGVIGPVHAATGNPTLAWRVGIAAAAIGGVLEIFGSIVGPFLKRVTPRAGMLGTLAGIALVWIAEVPLAEIFEHPVIGFASLGIVLVGLVAGIRLPGGIPAGLAAIGVGTAIGLVTGAAHFRPGGFAATPPTAEFDALFGGLEYLLAHPSILAVILPISIYNFIETMNNVESAEAAGDAYPVRTCQIFDGLGTLVGAAFGNPFPTTVYIGQPAYKRLGARGGYILGVGLVLGVGSWFGLVAFLYDLIPMAAVAPLLVFVGLVMAAEAFRVTPKAHAAAVGIAILPHVANLLSTRITGAIRVASEQVGAATALRPPFTDEFLAKLAASEGIHLAGQQALGNGAILVGLLWGAIVACLIDGRRLAAVLFSAAGCLGAAFGLVHQPGLGWHGDSPIVHGYLVLTLVLLVTERFGGKATDGFEAPG